MVLKGATVGNRGIGPLGNVEWGIVSSNSGHMRGQLPQGDGGVIVVFTFPPARAVQVFFPPEGSMSEIGQEFNDWVVPTASMSLGT